MATTREGEIDEVRREVLKFAAAGSVMAALGADAAAQAHAVPRRCNIPFVRTDQERHFRPGELPHGHRLPAHERLARRGIVFENHRINACVCTSSRPVLYTGRHIQHTRMVDNTNVPWISSRSTGLLDAGDSTASKGKWHLTKKFETVNELGSPTKIFTKEMEAYGSSD
jgi:arylsulfatase